MSHENESWPNPNQIAADHVIRKMRENPNSRTVAGIAIDLSKQQGTWEELAGKSGVPHWPEPEDRQRRSDRIDYQDYEGEWLNSIG